MEETDVGRVLAAVVPETVPPVAGLADRARAAGRRQRRRRAAMTGGGAGIALAGVVGAVIGLGGFGGSDGHGGGQGPLVSSRPIATPSTSAPTSTAPTSPAAPTATKPTLAKGQAIHDPAADAKVTAAVKAALPAKYRDGLKLYRADGTSTGYGAEYNMSQDRVLDVTVGSITPELPGGTPTMCQADVKHCTVGQATLHGDPVTWQYYYGNPSNPTITVYDYKTMVDYLVSATGQNPSQLPGLADLKDVGLNEQVATALLAAWPR